MHLQGTRCLCLAHAVLRHAGVRPLVLSSHLGQTQTVVTADLESAKANTIRHKRWCVNKSSSRCWKCDVIWSNKPLSVELTYGLVNLRLLSAYKQMSIEDGMVLNVYCTRPEWVVLWRFRQESPWADKERAREWLAAPQSQCYCAKHHCCLAETTSKCLLLRWCLPVINTSCLDIWVMQLDYLSAELCITGMRSTANSYQLLT